MQNDQHGLSTVDQVEALADQLSACADQLHMRLKEEAAAIAALPDASVARVRRHAAAEALFDAEQLLRQRANGLYADAAAVLVAELGQPQQHIIALTHGAAEKIRKVNLLADAAGLVAGLLALAGSVATHQAAATLAALETIRVQLKAVKADRPAPPA